MRGYKNASTLKDDSGDVYMGADRFSDGMGFSADNPVGYLKYFSLNHMQVALGSLRAVNGNGGGENALSQSEIF